MAASIAAARCAASARSAAARDWEDGVSAASSYVEYVCEHGGVLSYLERSSGGVFACGTLLEEEKGGLESSAAVEVRFLPSTNDKGT